MTKPFFIPTKRKRSRTGEAIDIAPRYFVYRLFEATNGKAGAWQVLSEIGETPATVARAVERGWVVVREAGGSKVKGQSASLTDEGRLMARKRLQG